MNIFQKSIIVFGAAYYEYANWESYKEESKLYAEEGLLNTYKGALAAKCFVDVASLITLGPHLLLARIVEWVPSLPTENNKLLFFIQKIFTSSQETTYLSFTSYIVLGYLLLILKTSFEKEQERVYKALLGLIFHSFLIFDYAYFSLGVYLFPGIALLFCNLFYDCISKIIKVVFKL